MGGWSCGGKSLMQTREKFYEVFALEFTSFVHKIVRRYLSIVHVAYFYHLPPHQTFIAICLFASVSTVDRKATISKTTQVHKRKRYLKLFCSLTRQNKIVNVIQNTRSCLSIYWTPTWFHFISQPCALHITFDKCFYNCDVVVEKYLYVTFLIHKKQFAFHVYA